MLSLPIARSCVCNWTKPNTAGPVRRRQLMAARRARGIGVAWLKAVSGECGPCEARGKASFEDSEGFGRALRGSGDGMGPDLLGRPGWG